MASLHFEFISAFEGEVRSALEYCRRVSEQSIRRAIWKHKLRKIQDLFAGYTNEEEEDRAFGIITSAESAEEMIFFINSNSDLSWDGWDALDDDLDEPDLDRIASQLSQLLDRREYGVNVIMRRFFQDTETLRSRRIDEISNQFENAFVALAPASRVNLADELLAKRDNLLDGIALMALRGLSTNVREFRVVIKIIQDTGQHRPTELFQLSWEVFYTEKICSQLQRGEYRLLLQTLPELVNPSFPAARRVAFFNMLRRWDREFAAMDELVKVVGSVRQQTDMLRFMDMRRLFMDNFPPRPQQPNDIQQAIQDILNAINGLVGGFQDLVSAVQDVAQSIQDVSIPDLLGLTTDDRAVNVTNGLAQDLLALLPSGYKIELINRMLDGAVEDEEEQAILKILRTSKERSTAEFLQIVAGATWEKLYNNFDGQEYDDLEALFAF